MSIFHLAYHVTDLDEARAFYGGLLGCEEGRSTDTWVDFDFFGHQLSLHLRSLDTPNPSKILARGFATVSKDDQLVSSVKQLKADDKIKLRLADGEIQAKVTGA